MISSAIISSLHLLGLGIGLGSVFARGLALRAARKDASAVSRVLFADNFWGIAALLWLGTGLTRVLSTLEKGTSFYLHNAMFHMKMTLFVLILLLELWPMITFVRWRIAQAKGQPIDTSRVGTFVRINDAEVVLVLIIVFVASMMSRGVWMIPVRP